MKNIKKVGEVAEQLSPFDHRRLGKEMDLFSFDEYVGPGLALWHPKGAIIRQEIENFWKQEHRKNGYQYVYSPVVGLKQLWEKSGHLAHFADAMFPPMDLAQKDKAELGAYYVKPMSCPFHVRIYNASVHSYKELPVRYCELGNVYRYEASGGLQGLLRVRCITQDDAHIICREDQFMEELSRAFDFGIKINRVFGYHKFKVYFSVRDMKNKADKYIKNESVWQFAEKSIERVLKSKKIPYEVDVGGAKFYGPAIDIKAIDENGKEWQCMTIQLDMNLPEKWGMFYVGADGQKHVPIMLHRALLGALERFIAVLLEQCRGNLPLWLAPVQVQILPVSEKHRKYAMELVRKMESRDIRVELCDSDETLGYRIRNAHNQHVPYILVVGDSEIENKNISVRIRGGDQVVMSYAEFAKRIKKLVVSKSFDL